jgi:D-xylose transport system ATP-binding protein
MDQTDYIIEMNNIYKSFSGVQALKNVSINLKKNEVVGIVGHNGAGKSTLIKILSGAIRKDSGTILIDKNSVDLSGPKAARKIGIETIYQDLALAGNLDVAANFFLGNEKSDYFFLRNNSMREEAKRVLQELRIRIESYSVPVDCLSGGQRQAIAIGRAIYNKAKVLIMDEPTAALGIEETRRVGQLINQLKKQDVGIFLISHDIHDVFDFCDRIAILKNGEIVGICRSTDVTKDDVISMIIKGAR